MPVRRDGKGAGGARKGQYPLEIKAQCVAAVLAGGQPAEVARRFGIKPATVQRWVWDVRYPRPRPEEAPQPEYLENLIFDLITTHALTLRAQLQTIGKPEWVQRQTAGELAHLLGTERDSLIRLLAGLRPVDQSQQLQQQQNTAVHELGPAEAPEATAG